MWKLIKLEWRKGNVIKYIRNAIIMTMILSVFLILTAGTAGADTTSMGFYERSIINAAVELYTNMTYIVFTGVMLAAFIVEEYEKGTISLMFSYPIKRKNILLSKIYAVWIFSVIALIVSKIFIYVVLIAAKSFLHISAGDIPYHSLMFWIDMLVSSLVMICISYIVLPIGLKMHSSKATVVAAVLIACFSHGNIQGYTLLGNVYYYAFLVVISCLFIFLAICNVEKKDVT